jgi:hypothetical protein
MSHSFDAAIIFILELLLILAVAVRMSAIKNKKEASDDEEVNTVKGDEHAPLLISES